jgi:hypothetical protein
VGIVAPYEGLKRAGSDCFHVNPPRRRRGRQRSRQAAWRPPTPFTRCHANHLGKHPARTVRVSGQSVRTAGDCGTWGGKENPTRTRASPKRSERIRAVWLNAGQMESPSVELYRKRGADRKPRRPTGVLPAYDTPRRERRDKCDLGWRQVDQGGFSARSHRRSMMITYSLLSDLLRSWC